jgi:hypothetical protein
MNLEINDRSKTVLLAALDLFRDSKQRSIIGSEEERKAFKTLNQYDLLSPQHALMEVLSLMARVSGKPVEHFVQNPSQNPQPKTHEPAKPQPSSAP